MRGYTEALRHELKDSNVHICCVHPGGINTNIAHNSRSHDSLISIKERQANFEKLARTSPQAASACIIKAIEKRKVRLLIGADAKWLSLMARLFPVSYGRFIPGAGETLEKVTS